MPAPVKTLQRLLAKSADAEFFRSMIGSSTGHLTEPAVASCRGAAYGQRSLEPA